MDALDCIIIGYNESPFNEYVDRIKNYGQASEEFRDLQRSFIEVNGKYYLYTDLLSMLFDNKFLSGDIPNLACVYLTNYLVNRDFKVDFINLFQEEKERLAGLLTKKPVAIAITTTFYTVNFPVVEIINFIRKFNQSVPIIVGGVLVMNHYNAYKKDEFESALADIGADIYVIEAQGEATLVRIIEALKQGDLLKDIDNIAYYDEHHNFKVNRRVVENNSLDSEVIHWERFKDKNLGSTLQTRTARSCAFACAFCGYPERGGPLTLANMDTIEYEMKGMKRLGGVQNVVFIDDTFNVPKGRFKEFCKMMIRNRFDFNWFSYYRCDHGDDEVIDLMAQSGCKGVFLGIESGSQEILVKMNKRAQVKNYENGIRSLKNHGILTFASIITGYPGENSSTIGETLDFLNSSKPDYWRAGLWYCDHLTPVYKNLKDQYQIEGHGFNWKHATMTSMQASEEIRKMFFEVDSLWLPQYSFDFWIIPYLFSKGISPCDLKTFIKKTNKLLELNMMELTDLEKQILQEQGLNDLFESFSRKPELSLMF